jgi:hypothetical protein
MTSNQTSDADRRIIVSAHIEGRSSKNIAILLQLKEPRLLK